MGQRVTPQTFYSKIFHIVVLLSAGIGTVFAQAPAISYIAPTSGTINGGTSVNIHGTNFQAGATVSIGGSPLNVTFLGSTLIQGKTTAHVAGGADIVVTNPNKETGI